MLDDGWFGERHDDKRGLGDWWVNPEKFPNGLHPLIEKVHSLGMSFGLWVEPEMVNEDSDLYREHPDWVYRFPNRELTESRNQLVLNLAKEEVREHLFGVLDGLLADHDISFIKWDMNRPFSEPGWPEAPPERQREVWVRHVWGVYEILGRLRENHPGVEFRDLLRWRRPYRPRHVPVHGSGLGQRQHRPSRPAPHPGRILDGLPRPNHDVLGGRRGQVGERAARARYRTASTLP